MTQQNADLVSRAADASQSMDQQTRRLLEHVNFFTLQGQGSVVSLPVRAAASPRLPQAGVKGWARAA